MTRDLKSTSFGGRPVTAVVMQDTMQRSDPFDACVRSEQDTLLNESISFALEEVRKHGATTPFAIGIQMDSQRERIVGDRVDSSDFESVAQIVVEKAKGRCDKMKFRCISFVRDVQIRAGGQEVRAVEVSIDHLSGDPVTCYLPYTRSGSDVILGEIFATEPAIEFFAFMRESKTAEPGATDNPDDA